MKIKSVSFSEKGNYVTIYISDIKSPLTVTSELYRRLGAPEVASEIDEELLFQLSEADEYYRATVRALRILSFSDNSRRRLYEKLKQKGVKSAVASRVVEDMVSLGYLDEKKQLETLVLRLANDSLFGKKKIISKLVSVGYPAAEVGNVLRALLERGEIDFNESFARLAEKKLSAEHTDEELYALKYKWGYERC